jgi:UDP-N-acetylglucosamine 2-epimerase (non-hydrolysing)
MKIAPVVEALRAYPSIRQLLVNTGQHYDEAMAGIFIKEFGLPAPDVDLDVGSGTHAVQTAKVMVGFEAACLEHRPDLVVVVGDVNSTMAATIVAAKLLIPVAHVEAGLRSFDREMPEEINRVVTDRVADLLLIPSRDAGDNLRAEGIAADRIHFVGNVMIDSLCWALPEAVKRDLPARHGVAGAPYAVVTLHRPANVDDPAVLRELLETLDRIGHTLTALFPVHPRTRERIHALGFHPEVNGGLRLLDPLGYLDMLGLVAAAQLVITDSGGVQEETTFLGVPCVTVRPNTERPVTCTHGTNRLVAPRRDALVGAVERALARRAPARPVIERWDGHAAERIVQVVCDGERLDDADVGAASAPHVPRRATALPQPLATG